MCRLAFLLALLSLAVSGEETGADAMRRGEAARKLNSVVGRQEALAAYREAAKLFADAGDKKSLGLATHSTGRILFDLGEYPASIESLQQAIVIRRETGTPVDLS